jgi:hypothetical protein
MHGARPVVQRVLPDTISQIKSFAAAIDRAAVEVDIARGVVIAVRGMVRNAAQKRVQAEDDTQQVNGVKNVEHYVASKGCRLQLISRTLGNAEVDRFVLELTPLHPSRKRSDTRHAAGAHAATEQAQVIPYAVANYLFPAQPPSKQPVIQQEEYHAGNGGNDENENLRTA